MNITDCVRGGKNSCRWARTRLNSVISPFLTGLRLPLRISCTRSHTAVSTIGSCVSLKIFHSAGSFRSFFLNLNDFRFFKDFCDGRPRSNAEILRRSCPDVHALALEIFPRCRYLFRFEDTGDFSRVFSVHTEGEYPSHHLGGGFVHKPLRD